MPHHPWWHGGEARHGRARRKLLTINGIKNWSLGTGQPEILSGGHHLDGFDPDAAFVALDNLCTRGATPGVRNSIRVYPCSSTALFMACTPRRPSSRISLCAGPRCPWWGRLPRSEERRVG